MATLRGGGGGAGVMRGFLFSHLPEKAAAGRGNAWRQQGCRRGMVLRVFALGDRSLAERDRSPRKSIVAVCEATGPLARETGSRTLVFGGRLRDRSQAGRDRSPSPKTAKTGQCTVLIVEGPKWILLLGKAYLVLSLPLTLISLPHTHSRERKRRRRRRRRRGRACLKALEHHLLPLITPWRLGARG
uniref:Uncharacterized protein n=1 Tax=Ananas comosus var. bracteatus TaxID=296719 RepID=A0A6V7NHJ0_ANACO|nr:unnamed protein product [Ananas comosus var. bracteatus]